jgi:hypothetical protein
MAKQLETKDIIANLEKKFPEMTGEFKRLQVEQYETFCRKQ